MKKLLIISVLMVSSAISVFAQKPWAVTISTQPNAIVWVNDVRRGLTDDKGNLALRVGGAKNVVRVRANGFKESTQNLTPAQSAVRITLAKTTDPAELMFHKAEWEGDREKAADYYRQAIKLRPNFAEAHLGLAKTLNAMEDTEGALQAIANARKSHPAYSEASEVEGKIHLREGDEKKAIAAFNRAIKEGNGIQPEVYKDLATLYRERAENAGGEGDFEAETANYKLAIAAMKTALAQLSGADESLYELIGQVYEKMQKYTEAIAIYEEYLRLFPNTPEAVTFRSYIVQVKKLMANQ